MGEDDRQYGAEKGAVPPWESAAAGADPARAQGLGDDSNPAPTEGSGGDSNPAPTEGSGDDSNPAPTEGSGGDPNPVHASGPVRERPEEGPFEPSDPDDASGPVHTTAPVRRRPSRKLVERLERWAWAHSRGLKVAAGIYFAALVVSIVAVSYVAFGLPALVVNLVAGVVAGPFFLVLCAIMAAVGIMVIVTGESVGLRLFCVVETIVVAWLTVTFVFGSIGRAGNALLDLWSQPVQAQATYLSYNEDDEGPDSIGVSVTLGDEESYESWPSEVADKLADYGVSEGDDFRVWVYPHTRIPLDVVNPAEYS